MEEQQPEGDEARKRNSSGMSNGNSAKRTRRTPRIMTSQEAAMLVPQALLPLVQSGVFTTEELGRLLLRTCKAMTTAGLGQEPDVLWKSLCYNHWGIDNSNALLEAVAPMSPRTYFHKMVDKPITLQVPRPLEFTLQDYVLIVEMPEFYTDKPILCKAIPGQDIPELFKSGAAKIEFENHLAKTDLYEEVDGMANESPSSFKWNGSLRILRRPDQRMELLCSYKARTERKEIARNEEGENEYIIAETCGGAQTFCSPTSVLHSRYGRALFENLSSLHDNLDGFRVAFDPLGHLKGENENSVDIHGFEFNVIFEKRSTNDEVWCGGGALAGFDFTFAHFLEAMMED